ncbi:adenosine receptor A3-like [Rhinatrema bivittatum]|uniref:adenosine receptor A3-like n=1 Tax=Rhinatrema bivittatum TaxID=194408 RepID=UPI0011274900|nr:adenosine receptor A3-like [Rhinatrema bivittatum]
MASESSAINALKAVYITTESIIAVCAIIGNALVIWTVKLNPRLQNTTYYFMVSLALADIAVGVLVTPLSIVLCLEIKIEFYTCLFMCCLQVIFTNASILSLLAIAIDRYLRIKISTRYKTIITPRRICLSLVACWIVSFLVGMVPMFGWNMKSNLQDKGHFDKLNCTFDSVISMDYMVYFTFFGWVLLPLLIMITLYIEIFYKIRKLWRQNAIKLRKNKGEGLFYGKEYKTAKSLALVLFLFAVCWLPLSLMNCLGYFYPSVAEAKQFHFILYVSILLSHSNSVMNPVVYAFKIRKFKETYIHILRKYILHRTNSTVNSSIEDTLDQLSHRATPATLLSRSLASCATDLMKGKPGSDVLKCLYTGEKSQDVKEHSDVSITCTYDPGYRDYIKYWCKGYYRSSCTIVCSTAERGCSDHLTIEDNWDAEKLIVTMKAVTKDNAGWYWCGIERNHLLDIMDYIHLTVSDAPSETSQIKKHLPADILIPVVLILVALLAVLLILIVVRRIKQRKAADRKENQAKMSETPETVATLPSNSKEANVIYSSIVHHPSKQTTSRQLAEPEPHPPVSVEYSTISYK